MRVRKALPQDIPLAVDLARGLDLAYDGMEADELWVAGRSGQVVGVVALKTHPDCLELCALGVDPGCRGQGLARELVEALLAEAPADVHLATIIPGFFEGCGFRVVKDDIPATFPAKRLTAWCDGCPRERCTVMIRKRA
jgi:N-acetylglutamate synthase-like GNAT family acetyltransferase